MSTISELIVAASVDPSGMQRGYTRAEQLTVQFAQSVNRIMAGTIAGTGGQGAATVGQTAAENLIAGLREGLESRKGALREMLARGVIDQKAYDTMGKEAGASFNRGLLTALDELEKKGFLTDDIRNQIVKEFEVAGNTGGRSFAQAFTATIHRHRALIPTLAGLLISQGLSSAGDVANAGSSLEKSIEQAKAAEKILENVAMLASFVLEPIPGLIAAVVGGSAAAIVKIWTHAKEETAKAQREFTQQLTGFARSDDIAGIGRLQQTLFSGDPFAAFEGQRQGESAEHFKARQLGIRGINDEIARLKSTLKTITFDDWEKLTGPGKEKLAAAEENTATQKKIDKLKESLTELEEESKRAGKAMADAIERTTPGDATRARLFREFGIAQLADDVELFTGAWQRAQRLGLSPALESSNQLVRLHRQVVDLLAEETDQSSKTAKSLRTQRDALEALMNLQIQHLSMPGLSVIGTVAPGEEGQAVSDIQARLQITNDLQERATLLGRLANLHETIKQRVKEEGGALSANNDLIQAQAAAEAAIAANRTLSGPPKTTGDAFANLRESLNRSQAMSAAAAAAKSVGAGNAGELEAAANAERQKAITLIRGMLEATDGQTASTKEGRQALEQLLEILNQIGNLTDKGTDSFHGMKNAIRGVVDAASSFGGIGRDIAQAGRSVMHVVDSVEALKKARDAAKKNPGADTGLAQIGATIGIIGGVVGVVNTVSQLFGKSETAREHDQLIRQNNDRLRELKFSLDNSLNSASGTARIQSNVDILAGDAAHGNGLLDALKAMQKVSADAAAMGEEFDQVKAKAKQLGIELFDSKGKLILSAFQQLADALELERKRMTQFTDSFDDQKTLTDLMNRVMGTTAPGDQFKSTLSLLQKFAPELAKGLEGIDATTEDGRKKIEAALQALVAQLMAGTITLEQFGDLEGAKQLASIIALLQDSLDGMKTAVDGVTGALNVPEWYKINAARVAAANPLGMPDPAGAGGPASGQGWNQPSGGMTFVPAGSGPISAGPQDRGAVVIQGDVYVDARERTPDELFSAVVKAGRRKAAIQTGNPSNWSKMQE